MANEELMEKKMTEDELEQVAGGRKVYVVDYLKNGKIKKLQTLAKGGKVSSIVAGASWRKHEGIKKQYIAGLIAKYKRQGYQIIVSYQR